MITSDAGLLAHRELDDALGLTACGSAVPADARTGKNGRHALVGLLRQSVFGRLAGYEDVNDAERLCRDSAMRWIVGNRAPQGAAASAGEMGRFETEWLTRPENLAALSDLSGHWIDRVHRRRPHPHDKRWGAMLRTMTEEACLDEGKTRKWQCPNHQATKAPSLGQSFAREPYCPGGRRR
jgi:hypothetical protein